jgi:hypothetical protein
LNRQQTSFCKLESDTASGKNIAKIILTGIGKVFYYFGVGLLIFGKLFGRGIQRAYHDYQHRQQVEAERRRYNHEIQTHAYYDERGREIAREEFRERERGRRQDERDQREYTKNLNKMFEVPQVNENAFFPDAPNKKKKKRSMFDF